MKITVCRVIKINLGNFENTDVSISMEIDANEGEEGAGIARLNNAVDSVLLHKIYHIFKARGANVSIEGIKKEYGLIVKPQNKEAGDDSS